MPHTDFCRLLIDPPASGAWNMAVDEALLESAARQARCCLRFYGWAEPTLSLGYFQEAADREKHAASRSCPLVRRASGGGAIVHDQELTYSLVVPATHRLAEGPTRRLYQAMHEALVEATRPWGDMATLATECGSVTSPSRPSLCSQQTAIPERPSLCPRQTAIPERPFLCFQRLVAGDVLYGGHKIAGSAQRRTGQAILQHGSLLVARGHAAPELPGLADLAGRNVDPSALRDACLARLAERWAVRFLPDWLDDGEHDRAIVLAETKYDNPTWTFDRGRPKPSGSVRN